MKITIIREQKLSLSGILPNGSNLRKAKKIFYLSFIILTGFNLSCSDLLDVESKTAVTSSYLLSTPDGLSRAVVGLYVKDRSIVTGDASEFVVVSMDYSTDLMVFRGGTAAGLARLDTNTPSTDLFADFWARYYQIIGKANEIIAAAEKMDMENEEVLQAWAEAKVFRGRSYFELYKRFERLYLNTSPTAIDNIEGRTYSAASKEDLFAVIKSDLDDAIKLIPSTPDKGTTGNPQYGRWTKAAVKHIRAQVAMWEEDWDKAISECEDIFADPNYGLLSSAIIAFQGADLNSREVLYAYQFSANTGGGNSVSGGVVSGHRLSLNVTPNYKKVSGLVNNLEYGGYGWGRVYPNTYLFSLYDQEKDKRYQELFRHKYYYNNAESLPSGKKLGDEIIPTKSNYIECLHPSSLKYFDRWTNADDPNRTSSFKDVILYRLSETYLMAAEAYFHRDGGGSPKAIEYYNKTWERAGNDHFGGPLTLDILVDEYARECHFEGVRWPLLKRLGLLYERVKLHAGDKKTEDPNLNADYIQARNNFRPDRDVRWPIPQDELDLMPGFGQNEGW